MLQIYGLVMSRVAIIFTYIVTSQDPDNSSFLYYQSTNHSVISARHLPLVQLELTSQNTNLTTFDKPKK